jgi:hypothetical protein
MFVSNIYAAEAMGGSPPYVFKVTLYFLAICTPETGLAIRGGKNPF